MGAMGVCSFCELMGGCPQSAKNGGPLGRIGQPTEIRLKESLRSSKSTFVRRSTAILVVRSVNLSQAGASRNDDDEGEDEDDTPRGLLQFVLTVQVHTIPTFIIQYEFE
jgi:hypothetical protein